MIDLDDAVQDQLTAGADRLRELAASLRAQADRAEHLLDRVRGLDTPGTWRGSYPHQLRGTLDLVGEWLLTSATAVRERADQLESAALDRELAADVWRIFTGTPMVA